MSLEEEHHKKLREIEDVGNFQTELVALVRDTKKENEVRIFFFFFLMLKKKFYRKN
jgi:hypothetical protein